MSTPSAPQLPDFIPGRLHSVRRKRRLFELLGLGLLIGAVLFAVGALAMWLDWWLSWRESTPRWLALLALIGGTLAAAVWKVRHWSWKKEIDAEARDVDAAVPELQERWQTLSNLLGTENGSHTKEETSAEFLQRVSQEAAGLSGKVATAEVISPRSLLRPALGLLGGVAGLASLFILLPKSAQRLATRLFAPTSPVTLTELLDLKAPQRVAMGGKADLTAEIGGRLPDEAVLAVKQADGSIEKLPLSLSPGRSSDTRSLAYSFTKVDQPITWQLQARDLATPWTTLTPVPPPEVSGLKLTITPPAYTQQPAQSWTQLPEAVKVPQGSAFQLSFEPSQPITTAALDIGLAPPFRVIALQSNPHGGYQHSTTLEEPVSFQIRLEDDLDQRNKATVCRIDLIFDKPPAVKMLDSSQTTAMTANDKIRIDFQATDDYGITSADLVATVKRPGQEDEVTTVPVALNEQKGGKQLEKSVELDLSQLNLTPDSTLSVAIKAQDNRGQAVASKQPSSDDKDPSEKPSSEPSNAEKNQGNNSAAKSATDQNKTASSEANSEQSKSDTAAVDDKKQSSEAGEAKATAAQNKPETPKDADGQQGQQPVMSTAENKPKSAKPSSNQSPANPLNSREQPGAGCSSCGAIDIKIEQFAKSGSPTSGEEKASLSIDPFIKKLREHISVALTKSDASQEGLQLAESLPADKAPLVVEARSQLKEAEGEIKVLVPKTEGTAYSFFGQQAGTIVEKAVKPAEQSLETAQSAPEALPPLQSASLALKWALSTLDALTKEYETVKADIKAAGLMKELQEMHVIFLENMPKWFKAQGNKPYDRNAITEVDEAYAKAAEAYLKKKAEVMRKLAELMESNPALQARFLDQQKAQGAAFRDEWLRVQKEQLALANITAQTATGGDVSATWGQKVAAELSKTVNQAAELQEDAKTWMPKDMPPAKAEAIAQSASKIATALQQVSTNPTEMGAAALAMQGAIDGYRDTLRKEASGYQAFLSSRIEDAREMEKQIQRLGQIAGRASKKEFTEALYDQQEALMRESEQIHGEFTAQSANFKSLGKTIEPLAKALDDVVKGQVIPTHRQALESLETPDLKTAEQKQQATANGMGASVVAMDALIKEVVRIMDEQQAKKVSGEGMEEKLPPSLEELLAALDEEARTARTLGIGCPKSNLQIMTDWAQKNPSSGSGKGKKPEDSQKPSDSKEQAENKPKEGQKDGQKGENEGEKSPEQKEMEKRLAEARDAAQAAARKAAEAQAAANQRAADKAQQLASSGLSELANNLTIKPDSDDWNKLPSELKAALVQEAGQAPPPRYAEAIRAYFKRIATLKTETPAAKPAAPPADQNAQ